MKEYGIDKKLEINYSFIGLGSNIKSRKENLTNACSYIKKHVGNIINFSKIYETEPWGCLLYTSPSPRDGLLYRMPSSA